MNAIVLVIVAAPLRGAAWPDMPSVLVHGRGLDGLDALVDGGGFLGAAEAAKRLGLALQAGHNLKAVFSELLFQNGEEFAVAGFWFVRLAPVIVEAAHGGGRRKEPPNTPTSEG